MVAVGTTKERTHRQKLLMHGGGFAIVILVIWYIFHYFLPRAVPTPILVIEAFWVQMTDGTMIDALSQALYTIFTGYIIAIIVGIPLGLLMGLNRRSEQFFDPYVNALYVTPFSAMVPALILWFGTGFQVRVVVVFAFAIFPIVINTLEGAKTLPQDFVNVARSFGANKRFIIVNTVLSFEVPYLIAGLRLGIGRAVTGLVIVERLVAVTGFGLMISRWSAGFRMEGVFSVVIVLMSLGVLFTWILRKLEHRIVHWDPTTV